MKTIKDKSSALLFVMFVAETQLYRIYLYLYGLDQETALKKKERGEKVFFQTSLIHPNFLWLKSYPPARVIEESQIGIEKRVRLLNNPRSAAHQINRFSVMSILQKISQSQQTTTSVIVIKYTSSNHCTNEDNGIPILVYSTQQNTQKNHNEQHYTRCK